MMEQLEGVVAPPTAQLLANPPQFQLLSNAGIPLCFTCLAAPPAGTKELNTMGGGRSHRYHPRDKGPIQQ